MDIALDEANCQYNTLTSKHKDKLYPLERVPYIRYVYIIGLLVWIALVCQFKLYKTDVFGWLIILIPIVLFLFGYVNAANITLDVEDEVFQANYLSMGLIVVVPLLTWINKNYNGNVKCFTSILVLALIITMLSMIDIWVTCDWLRVVKHAKSIMQTIAIVLIVYALYIFYVASPQEILK